MKVEIQAKVAMPGYLSNGPLSSPYAYFKLGPLGSLEVEAHRAFQTLAWLHKTEGKRESATSFPAASLEKTLEQAGLDPLNALVSAQQLGAIVEDNFPAIFKWLREWAEQTGTTGEQDRNFYRNSKAAFEKYLWLDLQPDGFTVVNSR